MWWIMPSGLSFSLMQRVAGNILRVHCKAMKCDVSFSLGSVSTLFRWGKKICHVYVKHFLLFTTVQKLFFLNPSRFSNIMITNVLPPFYGSWCSFEDRGIWFFADLAWNACSEIWKISIFGKFGPIIVTDHHRDSQKAQLRLNYVFWALSRSIRSIFVTCTRNERICLCVVCVCL